ncbi:probable Bax inhibitor 1 [Chrysoperla carnea]|uniref:probable Bax inhibitor 1 n=1 Tax=Chrysoperla carnea TaxID=189513 RepID=UPI001D08FF02|nr:probable Bax inhibitor 1 [Chrysoperla carnea]
MASTLNTFINSLNNRLEEPVRQHLKNVYACLTMSTLTASLGAFVHIYTDLMAAGFLTALGAIALFILLTATPDNGKNSQIRMLYLFGFTFLSGLGLGPLLEHVIMVDPAIIITAFLGTTIVFVSFSLCALLAERGRWLYLGGTLMTFLSSLMIMSIANIFFRSALLFQAHLYLGLFLMCGFVLYDTQIIIEKRRAGSKDFVSHSLDLFIDFIGIFRRLVVILTQKEQSNQQRSRKSQ